MEELDLQTRNVEAQPETASHPDARLVLLQEDDDYIRWGCDGGQNLD
jgi:hypothetical protein